jgi:hypothetical protein
MLVTLLVTALAAPTATVEEQAVMDKLAQRHLEVSCTEVAAMLPTPTESLARIAEHAKHPPWTGIRAAACLSEQRDAETHLVRWMGEPSLAGLARVVLDRVDTLPASSRTAVARAALLGPHAARARAVLARSTVPELRALAE